MKLLQKTNKLNIILSTGLLMVGGGILYFLLTKTVLEEMDEKLEVNKKRIVEQLKGNKEINDIPPILEIGILYNNRGKHTMIRDTILFDPVEGEEELFRELTAVESVNGIFYKITLRQVRLEPHDYFNNIGVALLIIWLLLLAGFFYINRGLSKKIWRPFQNNLKSLVNFNIQHNKPVQLETSDIDEFIHLNSVVAWLTNKAQTDYQSLKEFTENTAHEIQTPLSIIQTKLDEAMQSPNLTKNLACQLDSAKNAAKRMSRLNQSLLLLAKIENRQYTTIEQCDFTAVIENVLEQMQDFVESKNITIEKNLAKVGVKSNPFLLELLLNNLIGNAVKYSLENSTIKIMLEKGSFAISNYSKEKVTAPEKMFKRFAKANQASHSHGLGLSIVKKICELQGWVIFYKVENKLHQFYIQF
jgi:hypothetical protein